MLNDEIESIQPMKSLFEQSLLLFSDITIMLLISKKKLDVRKIEYRHANLE